MIDRCTHPNRYQEWAMKFCIVGRGETEDDARKSIWKAVPEGRPLTMDEILRENQLPGTKRRWYCPECGQEGALENVDEVLTSGDLEWLEWKKKMAAIGRKTP